MTGWLTTYTHIYTHLHIKSSHFGGAATINTHCNSTIHQQKINLKRHEFLRPSLSKAEDTRRESDETESTGEERLTWTLGRERTAGNHGIYPNSASPVLMTKTERVTTLPHAYITVYLTLKFSSTMWSLPWPLLRYPSHLHQHWWWIYQQNTMMISGGGVMTVASVVISLRHR